MSEADAGRRLSSQAENRGAQARDENKPPVQASLFEMAKSDQSQPKRRDEIKRTAVRSTPKTSPNMGSNQSARREPEDSSFASAQQPISKAVNVGTTEYRLQLSDGDYFQEWDSTPHETVKGFARWTKDIKKAARHTLDDWQKHGYIDLVCGFSATRLVPV
jgi:hypothetical protein